MNIDIIMKRQGKSELNRSAIFNILTWQDVGVTVLFSVNGKIGDLHGHLLISRVESLQRTKEVIRRRLSNCY